MTPDQYLQQVLGRVTAPTGTLGPGATVREALRPVVQRWATAQLVELKLSGSYAKGTAIRGGTDVDLFISLKADTSQTLQEIYNSLANHLTGEGYAPRKQNVSIGITYSSWQVDLTPGKQQQLWSSDHSLWVSRQRTWQKTNVDTHIQIVGGSRHTDVIRLLKRWRQVHSLELPSFALELAVLRAMQGRWDVGLAARFNLVLDFLRDHITTAALLDPANTNNNVADELTVNEKATISQKARQSRAEQYWEQVVS